MGKVSFPFFCLCDLIMTLRLKGQCQCVFSAIFNTAGLKPWLSTMLIQEMKEIVPFDF